MARTLSSLFIRATGLPTRATDCWISSSSRSLTLTIFSGSVLLGCSPVETRSLDRALHHQQRGDVIVDGQNAGDLALAVADIDGGGFEDLPVRRPGQVGQMVPGRRVIGGQLLHHDIGGPVPHLAAGDVAVVNVYNGVFRIRRATNRESQPHSCGPNWAAKPAAICLSISSRLLSKGIAFFFAFPERDAYLHHTSIRPEIAMF